MRLSALKRREKPFSPSSKTRAASHFFLHHPHPATALELIDKEQLRLHRFIATIAAERASLPELLRALTSRLAESLHLILTTAHEAWLSRDESDLFPSPRSATT